MHQIGFMQGRLSEMINGKIQSFPWQTWRNEFELAKKIKIPLMEWTLDQNELYKNPFMCKDGQLEISNLSIKNNLQIKSITGDCFMQYPFWRAGINKYDRQNLIDDFTNIIDSCGHLNVSILVIPLVDGGSLKSQKEENFLIKVLNEHRTLLDENSVSIAFESDYNPRKLKKFIERLDPNFFGINYDIGNSASLNFNIDEEFQCFGERIINVHIKDRLLGGATVPLGSGNANFEKVFYNLFDKNYSGNFILQTARDYNGRHSEAINIYMNKTKEWLSKYGS